MTEETKEEEIIQHSEQAQDAPSAEKKEKVEKKKKEKKISLKASEHQRLVDEAAEYKDKYLRLCAEFDNARKRMDREKQDFIKFANEGLLSELLRVVDHLDLSVQAAQKNPDDINNLIKGIEMVLGNALEILKKNGVEPIDVQGKDFDPNCHEILMQEPSEEKEGVILEEMQRGYMYHDRVLRTTKVKVAQNKT